MQRVGEEVSRFHYQTPARNPSGFWRGVDNVLKMREGTIEAFSSALSNHYQTPNDRWEAIGYAVGVPLAMGAELITTEGVLGLEAIENIYQGSQRVFGSVASKLERWGLFGHGEVESLRLLSRVERVPSEIINKPFITDKALAEGWKPPYPNNLSLRKITTAQELKLYRVHTDADFPFGRFLAREKEIAPFFNDPEALRIHLGLPEVPIYVTEVNVPAESELYVGRVGPQPSFGLIDESGFQYQLISDIPNSSFINTRLINQPMFKLNP